MRFIAQSLNRFILCIAISLLFVCSSDARERSFEIWSGGLADFSVNLDTKKLYGGFLGTRPTLAPSVSYYLQDDLAVVLSPSFTFHTAGSYFGRIMAGVIYHAFGERVSDRFFLKGLIGFDDIFNNRTSDTIDFNLRTLAWQIAIGKKFEMFQGVSYAPEVSFLMIMEKFSPIKSISFVQLQFTILF